MHYNVIQFARPQDYTLFALTFKQTNTMKFFIRE